MQIDVTFVGNATTLISCGDLTLLTDPNFLHRGQRAYLGYGLVSKRRHDPALTIDQLPPLDAVVLSHMHGDHWDRVAQGGLDHALPIITTPHAAKRLQRRGFHRAHALPTWATYDLEKGTTRLTLTALPGRHAPNPVDRFLPPVMGTMVEFGSVAGSATRRLYISGDTLLIDELDELPARFQSIDAGVLHLGGTRLPAGNRLPFGITVTMDGSQGAALTTLLDLPRVIPIHFDDYGVFASPLSDFVDEMRRRGLGDRVIRLDRGDTTSL
jgi:L-ascorbate metabolism protein UlaG (beta-lactamase superfamily)